MQDIKAKLEQARAEATKKLQEKMEIARMKAELDLLSNERFQDALVNQAIREQTTAKLAQLVNQCASIVADNPVYSRTLGADRKWNPTKQYGFGNQIAELSGLLSGIQYSVAEHNELMLAAVGLSPDLVERTLEAFGQMPYYSVTTNEIVVGTPTDVATLQECMSLIEQQLKITIDCSRLDYNVAKQRYKTAMVRAERAQAEAQLANDIADFVVR